MARGTFAQLVERAIVDADFRARLEHDPHGALADYDLSAEVRAALLNGDPTRLLPLGVEARLTRPAPSYVLP